MQSSIKYFFLAVFAITLLSCGSVSGSSSAASDTSALPTPPATPAKTADYSALARVFCDCAQPSIDLSKEMSKLQDAGKREEFVARTEEVGEKFKLAMSCAREKKALFTSAVLVEKETFEALMSGCPDIPERMAEVLSQTVK